MQTSDRLMWAVQALAQPAEVQLLLFPDFVCVPDELALDLDEEIRAADLSDATVLQRETIRRLDAQLEEMSGPEKPYWTTEALEDAPEWNRVRELSRECLAAFHWPLQPPPRDRAIYLGPP